MEHLIEESHNLIILANEPEEGLLHARQRFHCYVHSYQKVKNILLGTLKIVPSIYQFFQCLL